LLLQTTMVKAAAAAQLILLIAGLQLPTLLQWPKLVAVDPQQ
jgi:hypothetical protein